MNSQPKNYRKTPDVVLAKVAGLDGLAVNVGCVKRISQLEIESGSFQHLGVALNPEAKLALPAELIPRQESGRYSRRNSEGSTLIRRDLPKETRFDDWTIPVFGDYSKGTCSITAPIKLYPREHIPPQLTPIKCRHLTTLQSSDGPNYLIYFTVGDPIKVGDTNFDDELFRRLNLLRENVGDGTVFMHNDSVEELVRDVQVNWEILPAGHRQLVMDRVLDTMRNPTEDIRRVLQERMRLLESLRPSAFIRGTGGFNGYFGAQFGTFLLFENLRFGNAIYIILRDWQTLSQMSRTELLQAHRDEILRIEHRPGWELRIVELVETLRCEPIAA